MCCPLVFEFSVGIGGFVIGLGQISFFFSIESKTYIAFSFDNQNLVIFYSRSASVLERNHIGTLKVTTMTGCALQCSSTRSCFSFFYNEQIGDCSLHSNILLQTFENTIEQGWNYFKTAKQSISYAFI